MHILLLPSWYHTKNNKVHGSFFKEQGEALNRYGIKITVAFNEVWPITKIGRIKERRGIFFEKEGELNTYRYKDYNYFPKNTLMFKSFNKRYDKLFKEVQKKEGKIDIIHAHSSFWSGIGGEYLSKKYNIPLVITEHSSLKYAKYAKESYKKYIINSYKNSDKLIAVGENLKKELKKLSTREDIEVINNIVNLECFDLPKSENKNSILTFFTCGFLDEGKGFDTLIKAFSKSFKDKDAMLRIGGEGLERGNLENLIKELKIENQVILLGALSREEVSEEMKNCDVFTLASRHETFGVVYIEALASGKPVIATKNGGAEEIIKPYNGVLVEVDNIDELNKALIYMAENKEKFNSKEIREKCIKAYSEKTIIPKIINVYKELV